MSKPSVELSGRTAIVTGGSRGICYAVAVAVAVAVADADVHQAPKGCGIPW
ncbi:MULTISPECIES: hypothetical protein [Sphingosinicellaceae]|uniref:hypothetical protein n=1 Tax=Sphingosinicellaceae TaxID=2820280 RepID=UPI001C1DD894|nr:MULTISPECIES: hypothetical protein [Polymorphobacter]QYE35614.1 hypothetical protein KZX46_06465 [Polymorphobacter sp. PAMC 29334]UAJ11019.1 hypothetical protein KTC28_04715 [Polymorphobacter megasporae]